MIILEHEDDGVRERVLALFTTKAKLAVGVRGELSIRITSNKEMRELNRRFRRKNVPTDVLSFPSGMPRVAGDIAISAEIAAANADKLEHTLETELKILILHGLLHLAGYDHEVDNGEMRNKEDQLREQLNLPGGLIERVHTRRAAPVRRKVNSAPSRQGRRR